MYEWPSNTTSWKVQPNTQKRVRNGQMTQCQIRNKQEMTIYLGAYHIIVYKSQTFNNDILFPIKWNNHEPYPKYRMITTKLHNYNIAMSKLNDYI